jgi:hypothetical protein
MKNMKRLLLALILAALPIASFADIPQPLYTIINATTTTSIQARVFYGVASSVTQLTVVSCFDNSALSGPLLYVGTPTVATALGIPAIPPAGVTLASGFVTCAIATSVVAPGYIVYWGR